MGITFSFLANTNLIDYANLCEECGLPETDHNLPRWKFWRKELDHWYERGCYCGERGRCEVCIDQSTAYADHLRKSERENSYYDDGIFD
jgi:hypothetical protein